MGEPVFLLNDIMMTTESWVFQTRALGPQHRLVLHDFRGQLTNLMPGPFTLQQHVDDLRELMDRERRRSSSPRNGTRSNRCRTAASSPPGFRMRGWRSSPKPRMRW